MANAERWLYHLGPNGLRSNPEPGLSFFSEKKRGDVAIFLRGLKGDPFDEESELLRLPRSDYLHKVYTKEVVLYLLGHGIGQALRYSNQNGNARKIAIGVVGIEGMNTTPWGDSPDDRRHLEEIRNIIRGPYSEQVSRVFSKLYPAFNLGQLEERVEKRDLTKDLRSLVRIVGRIVSERAKLSAEGGRGIGHFAEENGGSSRESRFPRLIFTSTALASTLAACAPPPPAIVQESPAPISTRQSLVQETRQSLIQEDSPVMTSGAVIPRTVPVKVTADVSTNVPKDPPLEQSTLLLSSIEEGQVGSDRFFINQRNESQCAVASMTMIIASYLQSVEKEVDVNALYDRVLESFGREIPKDGAGVYGGELIDVLVKNGRTFGYEVITTNRRPYDPEKMKQLLDQNGPAIVDVNVYYLKGEGVNHWIVVVGLEENENGLFVRIADPRRSPTRLPNLPSFRRNPPGMEFKPDGTIILPWKIFSDSAGGVFLQLKPATPIDSGGDNLGGGGGLGPEADTCVLGVRGVINAVLSQKEFGGVLHYPEDYVPENLVNLGDYGVPIFGKEVLVKEEVVKLLVPFIEEARKKGYTVAVASGHRSYDEQERLYTNNPKGAATPGASQHQGGYAVDLFLLKDGTWTWNKKAALPWELVELAREWGIIRPLVADPPHFVVVGAILPELVDLLEKRGLAASPRDPWDYSTYYALNDIFQSLLACQAK